MKSVNVIVKICRIRSRPARGAWIEILHLIISSAFGNVAPRTGRVD